MSESQDTGKQITLEQLVIRLGKKVAQMHEVMLMLLETFKAEPIFQRHLDEYLDFDWSQIGARVIARDEWGATIVEWNGHQWKR